MKAYPLRFIPILLLIGALLAGCARDSATPYPTKLPTPTFLATVITSQQRTLTIGAYQVPCPKAEAELCYLYREDPAQGWLITPLTIYDFEFWQGSEFQLLIRQDEVANPLPGKPGYIWTLVKGLARQAPQQGVILASASQQEQAAPGETVSYALSLTNLQQTSDSFLLTVDSQWDANLSISQSPRLEPGQSLSLSLQVSLPLDVMPGSSDLQTLTARSAQSEQLNSRLQLTTTAGE